MKEPSPRRTPTEIELDILGTLHGSVSFPAGSPAKRFVLDVHDAWVGMDDAFEMTERQLAYLARIAWRYRRQLPPHLGMIAALKGGNIKSGTNATPGPVTPEQEQHILPF